jgi:hypothetical protein
MTFEEVCPYVSFSSALLARSVKDDTTAVT